MVEKYSQPIFSICFQFTGNRHDAEDLTQDVFLKIFSNLYKYTSDYPFLAWALKLTKNYCIDQYRRKRTEKSYKHIGEDYLALLASHDNPQAKTLNEETLNLALTALHHLPEETVAMILMRDLMGFSYDELSDIFSIPLGTVKSRLNRGRFSIAMEVHQLHQQAPRQEVQA